ncbi:MAG: hypothetical protein HOV79_33285 [Hamadaea sp.]|nr:hypothetical protein [Hamadaea sp.]
MDSAQPVPSPRPAVPPAPTGLDHTGAVVLAGEVVGPPVPRPPSRLRRVLAHGAGSITALAMWGGIAAIAVVMLILVLLAQIPALIIIGPFLTLALYGAGFVAMIVVAFLTIPRFTRRFAIGFLYGSLAAHVGLVVLAACAAVVITLLNLFM